MLYYIIQKFFKKTFEQIINAGICRGIGDERERQFMQRFQSRYFEQELLVGKKVIIVSNEWEDPLVGTVVGLETFGRNEAHLIVENAITHEVVISFGRVVPFSLEILTALTAMSPWVRWEILTDQKIERDPPDQLELKTIDQFIYELEQNQFFDDAVEDSVGAGSQPSLADPDTHKGIAE